MARQLGFGALSGRAQRARTALALALTAFVLATLLVPVAGADANGAPSSTAPASFTGRATVGSLLSASPGTWDGDAPISYAFQWRRCDQSGATCNDVANATAATYRLHAADLDARLRVVVTATNGAGSADAQSAATAPVDAGGPYPSAVLGTTELAHYWRLGESSGSTLWDSAGAADATATSVTLGAAGALTGDADAAARFDGSTSVASAPIDMSGTDEATVEFWLKWNQFANDDDLAMEFTSNFNNHDGGFLIDPNESAGKFAVSIGRSGSRNSIAFMRPTAGAWHHYALVLDTSAAAADQITPYVDGQAVSYDKLASGTGAGNFADAVLHLMSRNSTSLLGAGDLDELAIYSRKLGPQTVHAHYEAGIGQQPPAAEFSVSPRTPAAGQSVTFDASDSSDPDGEIDRYEWDLDGDGTYGTVTSSATVTHSYPSAQTVNVGLRVVDDADTTDTKTRTVHITAPLGPYATAVLGNPTLAHYWRLGEASGATLWDSAGAADASASSISLGAPGALTGDADAAARFDGSTSVASAPVDLSDTDKATVEFWLKWASYANDDDLAMEFTPDFNSIAGGFLVDPNAPQGGGKFAVSLGNGSARNSVMFARPTAGAWHHYAFVLDTDAPATEQITPYVDGQAVSFDQLASGAGAGNFADSVLHFMSRNSTTLLGSGDLDDLAIYKSKLTSQKIHDHYVTAVGNPAPTAEFDVSPRTPAAGQSVTFDASDSSDPDGEIDRYEWDLDGDGTFGTVTSAPTVTHTYPSARTVDVGVRVVDDQDATDTTTHTVGVTAALGPYSRAVMAANGIAHYWRLGESLGATLWDSVGRADAAATSVTLGATGALTGDDDAATHFNGATSVASAPVDLSGTDKATVEFWLKWASYANDDALAMEFTPNFNSMSGGFLVDPNAPQGGGKFAVSLGDTGSRNGVMFERPAASVWHHYAFVLDTSAPAADQIIPYVDGEPIAFDKLASNTGAGNFADSVLHFMSRNSTSLLGAGDIDDLAIYNTKLNEQAIHTHYEAAHGQLPPALISAPEISGQAMDGATLSSSTGTWAGTAPITYEIQWLRCDASGENCADIAGATLPTYKLTSSDVGQSLRVAATATNPAGSTTHESTTTTAVEPAPPTNTVVPKIGGIAQPGGHVHAHTGTWRVTPPITYTYQWRLCDQDGADCVDLDGQTDSTFDVGTGQLGHTLRAVVTATNAAGTAPVTTAPTRIVSGFSAAIAGDAREYQVLKAVPGDLIADDPASFSYQWQSCGPTGEDCADIEDATRRTYTLGAGDVGTTVRVTIAAAAGSVTASAQSETTPTVRNAVPTLVVPIVFGWAAQGHMLTTTDAVGPPSASFSYQWERCDTQGQSCVPISEATGTAHAVGAADIGSRLRVTVTATNSGGSISASSKPTTVVPNPTLLNTAAPRVTRHSSPDGDVMTADAGDWTGTAPISYRFQWQRCDTNGTRCANIASATDYRPGEPDVGATLRALVTASNADGSDDARSAASAPIVASAPSNAVEPSLSGQASVGQLLWADNGSWSGVGAMRFAYQWQRCDASGADCHDVEDQTDPTYQQGVADLGSTLRVSVTATNSSGSATSTSPASTIVTDVPATPGSGPVNTTPPSLTGDPLVGLTLTVDRGVWQSAGTIEYAYEWERCDASGLGCAAILDADGESYVTTADDLGAFVRAVIVASDANDTAVATALASQSIRSADGPANDALPVLSGTMREGQQVAVSTGEWSGESVDDFTYEWQRCEMGPDACDPIEGATNATYQLTGDEVGGTVRVAVTAKDAGQVETTAISSRSETIAPAAPRNSDAPSISGGAETGDTLHAATGSWAGISPIAYAYQWQSCDGAGEDCAELAGATQADYVLSEGDVGSTLRVTVTASNGDGHHEATSAAHGPIASSGAPVPTGPPTLSLGAFEGRAIVVDHGAWSGTGTITYTYQWQSCGTAGDRCSTIADATTGSYTPQADDVGSTVRAAVTAHDDAGARTILTDASLTIQPASPDGPSDLDLVNSAPPTISGDPRHGRTVSADPGGWTGSTAISFAYQWRSCDTAGKHCAAIDEANAASYTIGAAQVGRPLRVSVTASNGWGTHTAISEPTVAVTHAQPTNTALPSLSGDFVDGQTLNTDDGTWLGTDLVFHRQWQRCDAEGLHCADIADATDTSYQLTADDAGHTVRITITATNHLGVASASSPPSSLVAALAPASQAAPQIYGLAMQDGTLYADPGAWNGTPQLSFAYQWQSCDQDGEHCADITGAIQATYTLGLGDVATRLRVTVTATNTAGQSSATSDATDAIAPANEPVLIDGQPSITGDLHDGQQLTADPGPWHGVEPMAYAYQWKRCDTNGDQCVDITGATAQTHNLSVDDLGSTLRVAVTATNPSGSGRATADPTDVVSTAPPSNLTEPHVSGHASPGQELTVADPGQWSGSMPMTYAYQWERCDRYTQACDTIADATSSAYTLTPSDSRHTVRVVVTATNTHGYASESSYASYVSPLRPQNVGPPTINGTARVGEQLSANAGEWSPDADNYGYQWQVCAADGTSCSDLQWQTSSHFTPWFDQAGKTIRVVVSGQNGYDPDPPNATSAATAPVATTVPYNVTAPTLSTTSPVMDQPISATPGTWTGQQPLDYSYQWQSCSPWYGTSSCGDIYGATEDSYVPSLPYIGRLLRVRVTVINAYDSQVAYSEPSDAVGEGPPRNLVAPTVTGSAVVGAILDVDAGSWTGVVDWDLRWMRCDAQGEECHDRPGSEGWYMVSRADIGATLRAKLTGISEAGQLTVTTEPSDVVSAAIRPGNDVLPSITGAPSIGDTLSAHAGSWSGSPDITYDYDWQRCDSDGDPCESLGDPPGTPSDYLPHRADAGSTLRVAVTATNGGGSVTVRSAPTEVVPDPVPLSNVNLPSAGGGWPYYVSYGDEIRDSGSGVWAGEPELADQWQRCDPLTADPDGGGMECVDIAGATNATRYVPQAVDVGFKLRIKETTTTPDDTQTVFSDPIPDPVGSGIADDGGSFAGVPVVGETITGHDTATSPAGLPITTSYQFQRVADDWSTTTLQDGSNASYVLTDDDIGHRVFIDMTVSMWRADHATVLKTQLIRARVPVVQPRIDNDVAPSISGETRVGSTLTTTDGTWHGGAGTPDYTYRWQRCDAEGHDCLDIPGATTSDYKLATADLDKTLRVVVTAATGTAQASAVSETSGPIAAADVPSSVVPPAVTGTAVQRLTLAAEPGEWNGSAPLTYTYQWQRCDEDGNACDDIEDATSATHVPDESDFDSTLRVVVTATNAAGSATATANATAIVARAPAPHATQTPSTTILGPAAPGSTVVTDAGRWTNVDASSLNYQWQRCDGTGGSCQDIDNADSPSYHLTPEDVGARLQAVVSASNLSGHARATSELTTAITTSTGSAEDTIAYLNADRTTLYLAARDGSGSRDVADCVALTGASACTLRRPRISPNLAMIAVEQRADGVPAGQGDIYVVNFDGTNPRRLAAGSDPAWAPDGTDLLITMAAGSGSGTRIAKVRADGTDADHPTELVSATGDQEAPDMSPDSSQLTFAGKNDGDDSIGIYVADADGNHARRLNLGGEIQDAFGPRFSADGTQIIFSATSAANHGTIAQDLQRPWSVRPDGSNLHRLSPDDDDYGPTTETPDEIITTVQVVQIFGDMGTGNGGLFRGPRRVVTIPRDGAPPQGLPMPDGAADATPAPPSNAHPQTQRPPAPVPDARDYQPEIRMARDDMFWPVRLQTVLNERWDGRRTCYQSPGTNCAAAGASAVLPLMQPNTGRGDNLDYPAQVGKKRDQITSAQIALGIDPFDFYPTRSLKQPQWQDVFRSSHLYFYRGGNPGASATRYPTLAPTAYSYQYWAFFPYNYLTAAVGDTDYHEGDIEGVSIIFGRDNRPRYIYQTRHGGLGKEGKLFKWEDRALAKSGNHVVAWSARGSHAMYDKCGLYDRPGGLPNDGLLCNSQQLVSFTSQTTRLSRLAKASWACWQGKLGNGGANPRHGSSPTTPLWQQGDFDSDARPCDGVGYPTERMAAADQYGSLAPEPAPAASEDTVPDDVAAKLEARGSNLVSLLDRCADWDQAPDGEGVTVIACDQRRLDAYVASGLIERQVGGPAIAGPGAKAASETPPAIYTSNSLNTLKSTAIVGDGHPLRVHIATQGASGKRATATFTNLRLGRGQVAEIELHDGRIRVQPTKRILAVGGTLGQLSRDHATRPIKSAARTRSGALRVVLGRRRDRKSAQHVVVGTMTTADDRRFTVLRRVRRWARRDRILLFRSPPGARYVVVRGRNRGEPPLDVRRISSR